MSCGCDRTGSPTPPVLLQMLLQLGDLHLDVFSSVRAQLDAGSRLALAATCRQARVMCNASVQTVELSTCHQPLPGELAERFPRARQLQLSLCEDAEGTPCGSAAAAMRLEHWTGATPALLTRLSDLRVSINTSSFDHDLNADLVEFFTRCTALEALTITAADETGYVSSWHFSGHPDGPHPHPPSPLHPHHTPPPPNPNPQCHARNASPNHHASPSPPSPTVSSTNRTPTLSPPQGPNSRTPSPAPAAAVAMARQLAAFAARPYLLDPHSWPHYPCLTRLSLNHRLMIQPSPPAALEPPRLLSHILCTPSLRSLSILTLPPAHLDPLPPDTPLPPTLTLLKAPAYAQDHTPLPAFWHAIGRLPSLRSLHLFQTGPPPLQPPAAPFTVPPSWSALSRLTSLVLQMFTDIVPLDTLAPLTALRRLSVSSAAGGLSHLAALPHLTALFLGAAVSVAPEARLVWAAPDGSVQWGSRLVELSLEHCPVGGPAFESIGQLASLQVLRIHVADQTPASALKPLAALPLLTKLVVENALVGPQLCRVVSRLPALRDLHLINPQSPPHPTPPPDAISAAAFPIVFSTLQSLQLTYRSPHFSRCLQTFILWSDAPRIRHAYAPFHRGDRLLLPPKHATTPWLRALTASHPAGPNGPPSGPPHSPPILPHFLIASDADLAHLTTRVPPDLLATLGVRLWFTTPTTTGSPTPPDATAAAPSLSAPQTPMVTTAGGVASYAAAVAAGCNASAALAAPGRPPREIHELLLGADPSTHDDGIGIGQGGVGGGCGWLGDDAVRPFLAVFGGTLRRVVLEGCGGVTDTLVAELVAACTRLRELRLAGARRVSDRALWPLLVHGRQLDVLHISGAPGVTVVGVTALTAVNAARVVCVEDCGVSLVDAVTTIRENLHPMGRVRVVDTGGHLPPQDMSGVDYVADLADDF